MLIPVGDEPHHLGRKVLDRVEAGVAEHPSLDSGEEQLDLIDPRGVQRRVVEVEPAAVLLVELRPALRRPLVVNVEVVPDDVDIALGIVFGEACA